MSSSTASSTIHQNVVPSEVGWQFVPQYYTFVNKQPNRLHCFYTKSSTFVHGTEGEECKPCYGQHEIHEKITSIGFQDCKVFIHSVDAQASANGGIIIQVIGEMSNRGEPWRKFVQTFFLAEQPNGYFVLNDIFRFLKEESVEADDANAFPEPAVSVPESEPAPVPEPPQTVTPAREPTPPPAIPPVVPPATAPSPAPSFTPPAEEPLANDVPEPPPQPPAPAPQPSLPTQPNGYTPAPEPDKSAPPTVAEKSPVSPPVPLPAPTTTVPAAPAPAPPATAAPLAQPAPTAPRSWASLAASNSKKWGSAVAQESRGLTETPASPAPSSGSKTPTTTAPPPPRGSSNRHEPVTTPAIFIKGVTDLLTFPSLRAALSQFGQVQHVEVIASKGCAFAEFASIDSARQAITASHNSQGGGILVEVGQGPPIRVFIEARKERGERPPPRPRGGAPVNGGEGGGRGRHQGGGAYRGGMRRGAPPAGK